MPPAPVPTRETFPYGLRLDADDDPSGYVEQVVFSREGVELVFACMKQGAAPAKLQAAQSSVDSDVLNLALFVRESTLTSPGIAPVDSWFGQCTGSDDTNFIKNQAPNTVLLDRWCVGEYINGSPVTVVRADYQDYYIQVQRNQTKMHLAPS